MGEIQVVWRVKAEEGLHKILDFWDENNQSNTYSKRILKEIGRVEAALKTHPFLGVKIGKSDVRRILVLKSFSLYYSFEGGTIFIFRFLDNRDNPDKHKV